LNFDYQIYDLTLAIGELSQLSDFRKNTCDSCLAGYDSRQRMAGASGAWIVGESLPQQVNVGQHKSRFPS
jgi:hypothetical protein